MYFPEGIVVLPARRVHAQPLGDMRLPVEKAEAILKLLVEGMSIRSVERVTQVHRDTILRLL